MRIRSPVTLAGPIAAAPLAGEVAMGSRAYGGGDFLSQRSDFSIEKPLQPHLGFASSARWRAVGATATAPLAEGAPALTVGTLATRAFAATSRVTRARRVGLVSTTTAGTIGYAFLPQAMWTIGTGTGLGGFTATFIFSPSDAAAIGGARMFVGMSSNVATPTNVDPAAQTNQIGVAQLASSNNLFLVFGGSTAQTAVDLGSNFPANGLGTDLYLLVLNADPGDTTIGYTLTRLNTGNTVSGIITNTTPGTTLPANTVFLAPRIWRTNNTVGLMAGVDLGQITVDGDW